MQTMSEDYYAPAAHYDRVTAAWELVLGAELHYGVFVSGDEDLPTATRELTTRMIEAARLQAGHRVLDVGCGTGAPARRLASECGVEVLGITTSPVGAALADQRARAAGLDTARFEIRDGTRNGLPADSFDRVWVMESSHLMPARQELFSECARVLRPGGRLVLCDIIRLRDIPFLEVRQRRHEFAVLRAAFGTARMDTLDDYRGYAEAAGLTDISCAPIPDTLPTFDRWQSNLDSHHDEVTEILGAENTAQFEESLAILRRLWQDGTLGYGLVSASRPT
ncbi:MAG: hypothetical protein QOC66_3399 [Pseudonocardiales bacterium]|jgi:cyclopropane fatty-acyl-phospholipid synthase-like methyltransferase|nr:hypothetical protein [Pseudonocardiales bacterium]